MNIKQGIGLKLKYLRRKKGLTLMELEERTGVHFANINKIELGKRQPVVTTLLVLLRGLGCTLEEFRYAPITEEQIEEQNQEEHVSDGVHMEEERVASEDPPMAHRGETGV